MMFRWQHQPTTTRSDPRGRLPSSSSSKHAHGVDLVGPGGLLSNLTKQVLETGLEVEMEEHLGYEKHAAEGRNGDNSRSGTASSNGRCTVPA